ncbi:MAG: carboxypeptidase regulatory-like domain-containing protein [Planctomycetota bacterium]|jgi:protocatechuate 3,4-dioxygenase beta subunit|nr:carboxypeptidase regulatory-like domain-containing protein [Planctomycetota bacterium]MDP6762139.1 carboxypeptidase regulatory-like domain-containing protein [Planctomycetota bacterium]MDP6990611.1 carboxypeptidase regulatory-like domain-containing protein [Planctomycetota bacterium]
MTVRTRNLLLTAALLGLPLIVWTVLVWLADEPAPAVLAAGEIAGGGAAVDAPRARDGAAGGGAAPLGGAAHSVERRGIEALAAPTEPAAEASDEEEPDTLLVGRVTTGLGAPVAGARVFLRSGEFWLALPADLELAKTDWGQERLGEAETDDEGRFAFGDIEPGIVSIAVAADGYAPLSRAGLRVPEHERFELGTFSVEQGVRLVGRVVDAKGRGVEGVEILRAITPDGGSARVEVPGFGAPLTVSGATGAFRIGTLAPGGWHLIFDSPEHRIVEERGRTEPAGTTRSGLVVRLDAGLAVSGRLEGLDPSTVGGVRITARRSDEQPMADAGRIEGAERHRPRHALVEPDGAFRIGGLAPGLQYLLTASRGAEGEEAGEWRRLNGVERVRALPGSGEVVLRYEEASGLRLAVTDEEGRPVTRFLLRVAGAREVTGDGLLEGEDGEPVLEHPGGIAVYDGLQVARAGSRVTVSVHAPGFADWSETEVLLRPGEERDLGEVTLKLAGELVVRVVDDASGNAVGGAWVVAVPADGERKLASLLGRESAPSSRGGAGYRCAESGEDGLARLAAPVAGPCLVGAAAEGFHAGDPRRASPPVSGAPSAVGGEGEAAGIASNGVLELRLTRAARVVLAVVDPLGAGVAGMPVRHVEGDRAPPSGLNFAGTGPSAHTTDERGEVVFEGLEAGAHTFTAMDAATSGRDPFGWSPDGDWKPEPDGERRVELASGEELRVTLRVPRRGGLAGVLVEHGEVLAGARVQLVRIGESGEALYLAMMGSLSESPTARISTHEGRFSFEGFPAGPYALIVSHPERSMPVRLDTELTERGHEQRFELGVAMIEGRVTGEDGMPLEGLTVRVWTTADSGRVSSADLKVTLKTGEAGDTEFQYDMATAKDLRTGPEGRYELRGVAPDKPLRMSVSGEYVVYAKRDFAPLQRDETRPHEDFTMKAAGALGIRLASQRSEDRTRYTVTLTPARGKATSLRVRGGQRRTKSSLAPGKWVLEARATGSKEVVATLETRVVAGKTRTVVLSVP